MKLLWMTVLMLLTAGCSKSACEELADCLGTEAPADTTDEQEEVCQDTLDAGACDDGGDGSGDGLSLIHI